MPLYAASRMFLQDERNRLKEDFQSARETIDQLRNEISSSRQRGLASLPDTKVRLCEWLSGLIRIIQIRIDRT